MSKRTDIEQMAAAPIVVRLAGRDFPVSPLGFGAACLWLSKASLMEGEVAAAFPVGSLDENGAPKTPAAAAALLGFMPRMLALVCDYLGLAEQERDEIDAMLGADFEQSSIEVAGAYFDLVATANPTRAAQMAKAKKMMTTSPKTMSGRKSR